MSKYFQITGFDVYECNDRLYLNERAAKAAQEQMAIIDGKLYPIHHSQAEMTSGNPGPTTYAIIPRESQEAFLDVLMNPEATTEEIEAQRTKLLDSAQFDEPCVENVLECEKCVNDTKIIVDGMGTKLYMETKPR